ncbi:unnamed protein product [Calypogeia fissa]
MKKIAFPDNDEPIPFNNNKGGMKALVERRAGKRSVDKASTSFADANVFHFEADPMESLLVFKKHLADKVGEEELQETNLVSSYRSNKNCLDGFWARACSECEVELLGAKDMVKALIDFGSEVNLMSREVYEEGGWLIDKDIDWKINSVNSTKNPLFGACPDMKVKFCNVVEPQNIFVNDTLSYSVILGQPFITALRMETKVSDDDIHMAKIQSRDGLRIVQLPTMLPNHGRNRKELRSEPELSHWSLGNEMVPR